ncbi:MAG TPA: hypothetical protein VF505_17575 [Thermoanaerobaculia bacterium]
MRSFSLAVRVVAIVAVFSVSAVGQQPAVLLYPSTSIDLPIEPARLQTPMTLGDAAQHNDFPLFDAMFGAASAREASAYAELHSFWKWSMTDPVGAFYGDDTHARFAAEYPDYANYIADFGIIDSHGRAFYPSAETRSFLLRKAISGRAAMVAEVAPKPVRKASSVWVPASAGTVRAEARTHTAAVKKHAVKTAAVKTAALKPFAIKTVAVKPVLVKPVVVRPVAVRTAAVKATIPVPVAPKTDARFGRGLLLMIAGLIALGMLSLVFSASGDEEPPHEQEEPVEPLRVIPKKTA